MIDTIKKLLGIAPVVNFSEMVRQGAIVLDIRSPKEYANGHLNGAINISVDTLRNNFNLLQDKDSFIITCCASGMRSAMAINILKSNGYTQVYNGGSWSSLKNKINK